MKVKAPFRVVEYEGDWYLFAQRLYVASTNVMGTHRGTILSLEGRTVESSIIRRGQVRQSKEQAPAA